MLRHIELLRKSSNHLFHKEMEFFKVQNNFLIQIRQILKYFLIRIIIMLLPPTLIDRCPVLVD